MMAALTKFNSDFIEKLRNPDFASQYLTSAIANNDLQDLPTALGDIAKVHGVSKLAEGSGINRRTLYKVFDKNSNPSFELVTKIIDHLGLSLEIKPKQKRKNQLRSNMKLTYNLFYVDDVKASMNFYAKAFSLKKGFLHESNQYGEMITGETKIGFVHHQTALSHGFKYEKSKLSKKPAAFEIGFTTNNVQKAFSKAVKAGALAVSKPTIKPWGQTVSYVRDCNGFLIEICSPID